MFFLRRSIARSLCSVAEFSVWGEAVSVVRVGKDPGPPITEEGLQARLLPGQEDAVGALLTHSFFSFLDNHVIRFSLPTGVTASTGGRALGDTFEVNLGRALHEGELWRKPSLRGGWFFNKMYSRRSLIFIGKNDQYSIIILLALT